MKLPKHPTPLKPTSTDTMTQSGLIVTRKEGNVTLVELNRPKKRNALSQDLINELIQVLSQLDSSSTVRAVVLTGSEQGSFCGRSLVVAPNRAHADLMQLEQISAN